MKLLLDTHAFLWLVDGNPNLSTNAKTVFCDPANLLFLSVASVWELSIKTSRANPQLKLSLDLDDGVRVNYTKFGDLLADSKVICRSH